MIKIKDYIFNEKEIVSIELISGGLRVDLKSKSDYIDVYASFDDIEWNYGTPQETQRQMQKELCKSCYYRDTISNKLKDLEEEHKELVETNYNLATKKKELEKENERLLNKIEILEDELDAEKSISSNLAQRMLRAGEYLEHEQFEKNVLSFNTIINKTKQMLKGEENESN